jgi:hypothetical protein
MKTGHACVTPDSLPRWQASPSGREAQPGVLARKCLTLLGFALFEFDAFPYDANARTLVRLRRSYAADVGRNLRHLVLVNPIQTEGALVQNERLHLHQTDLGSPHVAHAVASLERVGPGVISNNNL